MKKIFVLLFIISLVITGCSDETMTPEGDNIVTQIVTSQGYTIDGPDGVQVVIPRGAVVSNTEFSVGYTGSEKLVFENANTKLLGKPFTLTMDLEAIKEDIYIKIPKPQGFVSQNTIVVASFNPSIPLLFEDLGDFLYVTYDNLMNSIAIGIIEAADGFMGGVGGGAGAGAAGGLAGATDGAAGAAIVDFVQDITISIVANQQTPIDNEVGLKQVSIDNRGQMVFSELSNVNSNDKILLLVHGWRDSPSSCWREFLVKIQPLLIQSGYTKFVTFGYYSGSPINNNGAVLADKIKNSLNGATIDIVAHSMGGLVSRSAIENHNQAPNVRNLITLGTPHKGSNMADLRKYIGKLIMSNDAYFNQSMDLFSQGMRDLQPTSDFIVNLNKNAAPTTNYFAVAGIYIYRGVTRNADGVVGLESALGVQAERTFVYPFDIASRDEWWDISQIPFIPHSELTGNDFVIEQVAKFLLEYDEEVIEDDPTGKPGGGGLDLNWTFENGVLTINGVGEMPNYTNGTSPWAAHSADVANIIISDGVKSIGGYAFFDFVNLQSVSIPNSVTSIGGSAFARCQSLNEIKLPETLINIEGLAFDASYIRTINIPQSVSSIGRWAFANCNNLASINVDPANANYSSESGVLYNKNKTMLIVYPRSKTERTYEIPNTVVDINEIAITNNNLVSVTIPASVRSIGWGGLTGNNVKSIYVLGATPPELSTYAISVDDNCTLYVPNGAKASYQAAEGWKDFKNIVESGGDYEQELEGILIGNQTWATTDLDVKRFRNGDAILEAKSVDEWHNVTVNGIPVYSYYLFDERNKEEYGVFYNLVRPPLFCLSHT